MKKKKQTKFLIGSLIIVAAISYLVYAGIQETSVYYLTVSDVSKTARVGEDFRMEGSVLAGSIQMNEDAMGAEFIITDSTANIPVKFKGLVPDMFKDEIDVVVQGQLDASGVFNAHTLLTSCPSRYEAAEDEQAAI